MTELAIDCTGVGKAYSEFQLQNMNIKLETGRVMGFIGPNGSGKSTTMRMLMGLVHQDCGTIRVLGQDMPKANAEAKRDIGYVSDDMRLYAGATLEWHMKFVASVYPSWQQVYADELLQRFDLKPEQTPEKMSHGQRVKASLLLAFARSPELLLLDEPTTGLDPVARQEVMSAMMEVLKDENRSILFSSHNTRDVEQLSDCITFIDQGQVIASSDKEQFLDRWRRIRVELPENNLLPELKGVKQMQTSGRLAVVTTDNFSNRTTGQIESTGATVKAVEHMTLEEIFVTDISVNRGRMIA